LAGLSVKEPGVSLSGIFGQAQRSGSLFRRPGKICRGQLSQLTLKPQAVDGPNDGFDNAVFVK
jgi:hypothetical protein